jgi:hypothetical protein
MRVLKVIKIVLCVVLAVGVFGYVTMRLWNWLMPELFGLHLITFAQAIGLVVLSKILFGGFHRHGGRGGWKQDRAGRREWKRRMKERFEHMSPEEKERFQAAMKQRWGGECGPRGWGRGREEFTAKEEVKG